LNPSVGNAPHLNPIAVRPRLASCLPRANPIAALSTSSVKSATALERQSSNGQGLTASGKVRKEVPLPSQEKKEGAMQYVLYVPRP
jgi:NADH dehydrogenase (ubiquinone) Fe-S protein 7